MFDEVSLGENGHQVIVSTVGDLINARRVSAGARSTQLLGHIISKQAPLQQEDDALSSSD
ncbi:hypothetical protein J3E71DRAFT_277082 [Bipolaris maydis]|nr:hypothetical protein J3E71DRAFT_277082 [Bipolaris maydis]